MSRPEKELKNTQARIEAVAKGQARQIIAGRDQTIYTGPTPAPAVTMRTLRRDVAGFTGRNAELRWLITAASRTSGAVAVCTIDGMPGVGKTALVTRAAHMLTDAFPDGQLFVNLHAHTPGQQPADPRDVLGDLLACTGMPQSEIPAGLEGRAQRWRGRLAGKKVLMVLDDAVDHAQVEPLLPGTAGSVVLITSRRRLIAFPDAEPVSLATLPPSEAYELFARVAHRSPVGRERAAVADLVEGCGHLPLAITLLASRLAHHPAWDIAALADAFAAAQDRLSELDAGDRTVTAAFGLSYRALSTDQQRLFRRLSLHPGPEFDAYAAAALDALSPGQARHELHDLYANHLIDEPAVGRFRLHDLLRAYAQALVAQDPDEERECAIDRLCTYYQRTIEAADRLIGHSGPDSTVLLDASVDIPDLAGREQAVTWIRTERSNLLACASAAINVHDRRVIRLAKAMASFLSQEGAWDQAAVLHEAALTAARHIDDRPAQADALHNLARARIGMGAYSAAEDLAEQALVLYRTLVDQHGEAYVLLTLCHARRLTGKYETAADLAEHALALHRFLGDRYGEAEVLRAQGWIRRVVYVEYAAAADLLERALSLHRDLDDRLGEARALSNLRVVRQALGEYSTAADLAEQALALYRALGNLNGEADALRGLSWARCSTGNYKDAADLADQALALYRSLGHRHGEAEALQALGRVRVMNGEFQVAAGLARRALTIYQALDFGHGKANALRLLGQARYLSGNYSEAADLLKQARTLFRHYGDDQGEAEVLNCIGALLADTAGPQEALPAYRQARQLACKVQSPLDEANALQGAAECLKRSGRRRAALVDLRSAVAIYQRIGAAEAVSAAEHLAALQANACKH
ncbi:tetratricopeptide repeat protein [Nonomuraea sp. NPDC052129]|uniref:ATP-binding protein n=1 Tax=Nonomuraea sp. NPDC052129 TaxID=3154651 RepID=UPI00343EF3A7